MSQKREKELRKAVREAHAAAEEAHLMANTCAIIKSRVEREATSNRRYADRLIMRQIRAWNRVAASIQRSARGRTMTDILQWLAIILLAVSRFLEG